MANRDTDHKIVQQIQKGKARQVEKVDSVQAGPTSATPRAKAKVRTSMASSLGPGLTKLDGMDMGRNKTTDYLR